MLLAARARWGRLGQLVSKGYKDPTVWRDLQVQLEYKEFRDLEVLVAHRALMD